MNKLSESRYYTSKNFRMTSTIEKLLKARALEDECSESDVVRRALTLYLTKSANETQLIHSSLVDSKRKIATLDKKVETAAVVLYKLAHEFFRQHPDLPNTASREISERMADRRFEQFTQECTTELQSRHGLVESLILSVYQKEID